MKSWHTYTQNLAHAAIHMALGPPALIASPSISIDQKEFLKPIEHTITTKYGYSIPVWSAYTYTNTNAHIEDIIHQGKYRGNPIAHTIQAQTIAHIITQHIIPLLPSTKDIFLLPAPSSYIRTMLRGYSHTKEITKRCIIVLQKRESRIHWQLCPPIVQRTLYAPAHATYNKKERLQSAERTFKKNPRAYKVFERGMKEKNTSAIIIIDDVSTTGATLGAMAHSVHAEIPHIWLGGCTYAHTPLSTASL